MIVVKLKGGLGNQLFQYAFAKSINSSNQKVEVKFDASFYQEINQKFPRDLTLASFIDVNKIDKLCVKERRVIKLFKNFISFLNLNKYYQLNLFFTKILYSYSLLIDEEFKYGYSQLLQKRFKNKLCFDYVYYFNGYWCDIRYFESNLEKLKQDVKLHVKSNAFSKILGNIFDSDIVLHIRRGDYLKIGNSKDGLFIGLEYYKNAISFFKTKLQSNSLRIWVLSDDPEWCKSIFSSEFNDIEFVWDAISLIDTECFEFMRFFNYYIIANSTFSLWAVYISYRSNPYIVYPKTWSLQLERNNFKIIPDIQDNWIGI